MAFDAAAGGDPRGIWCRGCRRPITGRPTMVRLASDPRRINGAYHDACARPLLALAQVIDFNPWSRS